MGYSDWIDGSKEERDDKPVIVGDFDSIPMIDVSGMYSESIEERQRVATKIREACMRVGFFYIENHGIPQELVDGAFDWARKFFGLSFEDKMKVYIDNSPNFRGYTPLGGSGRPGPDGKGNANEAFDWGHDYKVNDDPNEQYLDPHMRGVNQWPQDLPGFEEHLSAYYRCLRDFCRVMTNSVALSLDLPEDYFKKYITHPGCSTVLAHYPPQGMGSTSKGLDPHSDAEFFTILAPGDVRALEVANRAGQWISAPPKPGTFIVNVGDQLQAWTNDLYVSTRHRVMNYSGQERYSIPFFFSANWETVIEPIPELIKGDHVARYPSITAGKMYKDMMTALHKVAASNPEFVKYRKPIIGIS